MIKFFRHIRQTLLSKNKFNKYILYAIGEIVLVVIGILIALSINNANEMDKIRVKEHNYLQGIKADLSLNLSELQNFIHSRENHIKSANILLDFYEDTPVTDLDYFNYHTWIFLLWFPSDYNSNTFQELLNSGNLAIISNDSIKNDLLNMEIGYKKIRFVENHLQHDFEGLIYDQYFSIADVNPAMKNFIQQNENSDEEAKINISEEKVEELLRSQKFKNGCALSVYNNKSLIQKYNDMISTTKQLITRIDKELE